MYQTRWCVVSYLCVLAGFEPLDRALPSSPRDKGQRRQQQRRQQKHDASMTMMLPFGANGSWLPKPRLLSERIRASSTPQASAPEPVSPSSVLWFSMAQLHTDKQSTPQSPQTSGPTVDISSAFAIVWTTIIRQELFGKQLPWRLVAFPTYPDDDGSRPNADAHAPGACFEVAQGTLKAGPAQDDDDSDGETDHRSSDSGDERRRRSEAGDDDLHSNDEVAHRRRVRTAVAFVWTTPFLHNFRIQIELGVPVRVEVLACWHFLDHLCHMLLGSLLASNWAGVPAAVRVCLELLSPGRFSGTTAQFLASPESGSKMLPARRCFALCGLAPSDLRPCERNSVIAEGVYFHCPERPTAEASPTKQLGIGQKNPHPMDSSWPWL